MAKERIRVRLRGFDIELIDQSAKAIVGTVAGAGAEVAGPIPLPTKISKYTVLRSPHVNKKSREQFEMRTHKRLIDILNPTPTYLGDVKVLTGTNNLSTYFNVNFIGIYRLEDLISGTQPIMADQSRIKFLTIN